MRGRKRRLKNQSSPLRKSRRARAVSPTPPETKPPHQAMLDIVEQFLSDVECTREMYDRIVPLLKSADLREIRSIRRVTDRIIEVKRGRKSVRTVLAMIQAARSLRRHAMRLARASGSFRAQVVVTLVSRFDAYTASIVAAIVDAYPGRLTASERGLTYEELMEAGSFEEARARLAREFVRGIGDKGRPSTIAWLSKSLNVDLEARMPHWKTVLELCERRNAIVHRDGIADAQYIRQCKTHGITLQDGVTAGKPLSISDAYFDEAANAIFFCGLHIGDQVYRALFPRERARIDLLLNDIGLTFLRDGNPRTSEAIYEHINGTPLEEIGSEEYRLIFRINYALALRDSGKIAESEAVLDAVDWKTRGRRFTFGVAALRGRFAEAAEHMIGLVRSGEIMAEELEEWPILRRFRARKEFRAAYRRAFRRDWVRAAAKEIGVTWTPRVARPSR
jgi:hypothetical protein